MSRKGLITNTTNANMKGKKIREKLTDEENPQTSHLKITVGAEVNKSINTTQEL